MSGHPIYIEIDRIMLDEEVQPRAEVNFDVVLEYAEAMKNGRHTAFPPVVVFRDRNNTYWLADGWHRVLAAKRAGLRTIAADVRGGTKRDAVLYSVGANATHGLRRTNADKRAAVEKLLRDPEWGQWSDNEIARRCVVSQPFVSQLRRELGLISETNDEGTVLGHAGRRYITRHGTEAVMDTSAIGHSRRDNEAEGERAHDLTYNVISEVVEDMGGIGEEPALTGGNDTEPPARVRGEPKPIAETTTSSMFPSIPVPGMGHKRHLGELVEQLSHSDDPLHDAMLAFVDALKEAELILDALCTVSQNDAHTLRAAEAMRRSLQFAMPILVERARKLAGRNRMVEQIRHALCIVQDETGLHEVIAHIADLRIGDISADKIVDELQDEAQLVKRGLAKEGA